MIIEVGDDILGKNIQIWREKRGMYPVTLAERTGIPADIISGLEKGVIRAVDYDDLLHLSCALGATLENLIEDNRK